MNLSHTGCRGTQKGSHQYSASAKKLLLAPEKSPTFNRQSFDSVPLDWAGWKLKLALAQCLERELIVFLELLDCFCVGLLLYNTVVTSAGFSLQIAPPSSKQIICSGFSLQEFFNNYKFFPIKFLNFPTKALFSLLKTQISPPYKRLS